MKICLIHIDDFSMFHFRENLIRALIKKGCSVSIIVPQGPYVSKIRQLGTECIPISMKRFFAPLNDLFLIWRFYRVFQKEKYDIVHTMTIKPNIYGTMAAKLAGVPRVVCLVSGMGFVFNTHVRGWSRWIKPFVKQLYHWALVLSDKTWFQNPDDFEEFKKQGIISKQKGVVILGGGINLDFFAPWNFTAVEKTAIRKEIGVPETAKCALLITARRIWSKGLKEFKEAVEMLHADFPDWYFIMLCPKDKGTPDSVPDEYLHKGVCRRLIVIDEFRKDIKRFIGLADLIVLPSYYSEGVPRTLLEGLSMAKPIITTDHPGCRETVEEGINGYLVPIKDSNALADKMAALMKDANKRHLFGKESRKLAERKFADERVISLIFKELYCFPQTRFTPLSEEKTRLSGER